MPVSRLAQGETSQSQQPRSNTERRSSIAARSGHEGLHLVPPRSGAQEGSRSVPQSRPLTWALNPQARHTIFLMHRADERRLVTEAFPDLLITREIPWLCRGGSKSLTVPAIAPQAPTDEILNAKYTNEFRSITVRRLVQQLMTRNTTWK
jgi:hypothetical protein